VKEKMNCEVSSCLYTTTFGEVALVNAHRHTPYTRGLSAECWKNSSSFYSYRMWTCTLFGDVIHMKKQTCLWYYYRTFGLLAFRLIYEQAARCVALFTF
jgi:intracellular septation protein A